MCARARASSKDKYRLPDIIFLELLRLRRLEFDYSERRLSYGILQYTDARTQRTHVIIIIVTWPILYNIISLSIHIHMCIYDTILL